MPKHHPKPHHKGEGIKLAASPEELISLLIADAAERAWANNQIANEGPRHKQVLSALLLKRLYKLVQVTEKSTGTAFELQKGYEIVKEKEEEVVTLPVSIPINLGAGADKEMIAEAVTHAPEHESLAYIMALQVIEWAIKAAPKNSSNN